MRYVTDDGETFDTIEEAQAHEDEMGLQADLSGEVDAYLDSSGFSPKDAESPGDRRTRNRAYNQIMAWLRYDREAHPERYMVAPDPQPADDPVVAEMGKMQIAGPK